MPAQPEIKKSYTTISIYFPNHIYPVYEEFKKLCKNKLSDIYKVYPDRVDSIILRRQLISYVYEHTQDEQIKKLIGKYQKEELSFYNKIVESYKQRNKDKKGIKQEIDEVIPKENIVAPKKVEKKVEKKPVKKIVEEEPELYHHCPECDYNNRKEDCLSHQKDCIKANRLIKPKWLEKEKSGE